MTGTQEIADGTVIGGESQTVWTCRRDGDYSKYRRLKYHLSSCPDFTPIQPFDFPEGASSLDGAVFGGVYYSKGSALKVLRETGLHSHTSLTVYSPTPEIARQRLEETLKDAGVIIDAQRGEEQ